MSDISDDALAAIGKTREEYEELNDVEPSKIDISLSDHVDSAIQRYIEIDDGESERHKSRVGVYHASGAGKCLRKRWYSDKGVVKSEWHEFPVGIGHRGDVVEDEVENGLDACLANTLEEALSDVVVGNEYPVSQEITDFPAIGNFYITGSTDPYVEDQDGNLIEIIEVKSTGNIPDSPHWYHEMQLNTYLSILGVSTGTIFYVDPSDWENRVSFCYEQDQSLWEFTKVLHGVYHLHRKANTLPPRTPIKENECDGCPYKGHCLRNDRADDFTESTFPPTVDNEQKTNIFTK